MPDIHGGVNVYDKDGVLDATTSIPSDCWNWTNYSYLLTNGISAFEYAYTGLQVEGNTSIDNVTLTFPNPWNICVKDVLYATEYQMNLEAGNVLRGQAFFPSPEFPAPLTGYYNPTLNTASFSMGYLVANATRHYWIDVATMTGWSWGILANSIFYDGPRPATLGSCTAVSDKSEGGATGAP